jgi:hypothetical protein
MSYDTVLQGLALLASLFNTGTGGPTAVSGCRSDLDCSLNGDCLPSGECDCDPAWEGTQCERFAQLPTPSHSDIKETNVTTWGGGPLQRKVNGSFHMYVAEMVGSCGITTWQTTRRSCTSPQHPRLDLGNVVKSRYQCGLTALQLQSLPTTPSSCGASKVTRHQRLALMRGAKVVSQAHHRVGLQSMGVAPMPLHLLLHHRLHQARVEEIATIGTLHQATCALTTAA